MKILKLFFLILMIDFSTTDSFAYDTFTHELISIRSSVLSSNYQKFVSDFGADGVQQLREGSVKEDDLLSRRPVNHFYDPNDKRGLNIVGAQIGRASREWGFDGGTGTTWGSKINDYSWSKSREYMYLGLTSSNSNDRNNNLSLMFRSIGQVMHLVQDLAQPSHTRNDLRIITR